MHPRAGPANASSFSPSEVHRRTRSLDLVRIPKFHSAVNTNVNDTSVSRSDARWLRRPDRGHLIHMDAITLLKDDHKTVEQLFKRFEKAGDRATTEKRRVVDRIIEELSMHAAIEEQVFYPVVRATVDKTEDEVLESLEEHHIVKWVLSELERMDPADERFDAKVTVLMENVRHHVRE